MKIEQFNFAGKKAIVRVDFNVPLDENGNITDDTRIRGALPTLKKILADGGAVIMMSHMGKPKGKVNPKLSLSQIVNKVSERLGVPVKFADDCANATDAAANLKMGEALLLENLRFYPEEEGKPVGIDKADPAYEEAKKEMEHLAMAAGASLAGIAVLGPIGVVAGAFVRGKNVDHPAGTELYIQTKDETTLYGVQTTYDSAAPFQSTAARTSDTTTTNDEGYDNSVYNDAA